MRSGVTFGSVVTRSFEALGLRGAPSILRHASRFSDRLATVIIPSGEQITFPALDSYWCRYLYAGVPYEPDVEIILRRFAQGRTLIDCGANIGYWSVRAPGLGFEGAIAIEANADHIPILSQNHDGKVIHAAVHSMSGELLHLAGGGAVGSVSSAGQPVQSLALSDLDFAGPCVVKLDVEGAEIAAIEGAKDLDAIFVYEDWPKSGMTITRWLLSRNFLIAGFDGTTIGSIEDALTFNQRTNTRYGPSNFVALRA